MSQIVRGLIAVSCANRHGLIRVVYESTQYGWRASAPGFPGYVVEGATLDEAADLMRQALEYLQGRAYPGVAPQPSESTADIARELVTDVATRHGITTLDGFACPIMRRLAKSLGMFPDESQA